MLQLEANNRNLKAYYSFMHLIQIILKIGFHFRIIHFKKANLSVRDPIQIFLIVHNPVSSSFCFGKFEFQYFISKFAF